MHRLCLFFSSRHLDKEELKYNIHTNPFVSGQCVLMTHCHYVRSAVVCADTDRLVNMVEAPLILPCPWVNSINVTPDNLFHIY